MISKEHKTFELYAIEIDQGVRPQANIENQQFTQQETSYINTIIERLKQSERTIPSDERLLNRISPEDMEALEKGEIQPFSVLIFAPSELIRSNKKTGSFFKLAIQKEYLLPELEQRFAHVVAPRIEFDIWMLQELDREKRVRILATIAEWEKQTGSAVRFEAVVGKRD